MSARRGTGSIGLGVLVARTLLACVSLIAGAVCDVRSARAEDETVLLMVPQTPEPALVELFHRVEAELRLHEFRPEVLVAPLGDSTESLLGAQASAQRAFAAIAIVEQAQSAMLHVWIVDSRTGLTRQYRVTQPGGEEPVNVVAVRAIDLLRANRAVRANPPPSSAGAAGAAPLSTPQPTASASQAAPQDRQRKAPPPSAAGSGSARNANNVSGQARPAPTAERDPLRAATAQQPAADSGEEAAHESAAALEIQDTSAPETYRYRPTRLQVAAEVAALSLSRRLGWSFAPSIGAWLTLGERLRVGIVAVAPLWGATLHAPLGEPAIWQELLWIELGVMLLRAGPLQLSAAGGGGLHGLQAVGRAPGPYRSNNGSVWSWTASLAARADVMLSEHWSLGVTLRARVFLPAVEIAVETESARLALPAIEGALGMGFWL